MSIKTKELVNTWGGWLGEESWDYFSTITYRYDISARRNENIMLGIEELLKNKTPSHKLFWIMEYTSNNYHKSFRCLCYEAFLHFIKEEKNCIR